ncbi:CDP-diacylglycerol--serine O-phosphatidyltransferase [Marinivivus vitaminiproducens]|uniref:CDP-diacylglycerol--serine O-phosphatidyltransferase n=1 Tax=Marinivivus vitaminiproducens TaxID=3035935 RepID=UPI0027A75588|nr:CDP-diacylglycerol--serine O-phosphatidyltransferase [Geminicoccaceae bacterium SCSIO 64248]
MRFARRRRPPARPRERRHAITLVPHILTLMGLCAGLTSIRYALDGRYELAVIFVIAATVLDGLDGRAARLLKCTSRFGAELDSLADFLSFGVAPALLVYLWVLHEVKSVGWALALLLAVCCALRLARFNVQSDDPNRPAWMANFFTGVPAPAGAGLALLPLILSFATQSDSPRIWLLNAALVVAVSLLMVSQVPTWSIKRVRIRPEYMLPSLVVVGVIVSALLTAPWGTLFVGGAIYLLTLPWAVVVAQRYRRNEPGPIQTLPSPSDNPQAGE